MVQNNKVLTVSYGTFSCTLEGFEDSFDTMKAIAEYFRDLAADDRYFGAEPPQPDADMLARIAEREIARQVEARRDDKGIVLRAAAPAALAAEPAIAEAVSDAQTAGPVAEAPVSDIRAADAAPATAEPVAEAPVEAEEPPAQAPEDSPEVAEDQPAPADDAPIIKASDDEAPEMPVSEAPEIAEAPAEAEVADAVVEDDADSEALLASIAAQFDDLPEDAVEAQIEDEDELDILPMAEVVEDSPEAPVAPDSIAAKLQRIRAVVSRNEQASQADARYTEDEHAENVAELDTIDEDANPIDQIDSGLAARFAPETDQAEEASAEALSGAGATDDEAAQPEVESRPRVAVRVSKVKRTEVEAETEEAETEEVDARATGSLSPEDEDDLLRELAAVEAEYLAERGGDTARTDVDVEEDDDDIDLLSLDDDDEDTSDVDGSLFAEADATSDDDDVDTFEGGPETTRAAPTGGDDDISRLLAAADEKLGDPDLSSTRETYSQMRAAVAATRAERSAGGTLGSHSSEDEYRTDLSEVVRPRRPVASGSTPRARTEERPAPLKLVAEQRIDTKRSLGSGPVRPRRVASLVAEEAPAKAAEGSFADFVAETGASGLHELLEAAASYLSFVEGRDQFSRPQLMNKVRQLDDQEFNREDGLRSFGQLLREGKLKKTASGQFTASGQIGFRPDNRAAG
ncbi:chemotaxis protein CheA [Ruegeria pomeroyi]|uniref:chemotaxis protein CheA n=1 Tax=Ruegeria pomeroyi TaxID=89184 RepID=UPI001F24F812|nr:chemotaxis protein CheA [Ruegeria pomeroyi]MCE8510355.1 chemotaxis protein CheA [Ruegeria pomeroyi]